jgi:RNA polymerase sigma factor (sigma-70 family)
VLRADADAEDAFQATFLVLARRAGTIRRTDALACWFHRVAFRCATDLRRSAMRRHAREQKADDKRVSESAASEASLRELQAILDAEIERLPAKCRAPFILCCLEGKSRIEASQTLGWKEGTVAGRLAQARAILQKRLMARGVTLSAALGAVALAPLSLTASLPAALAHRAIDGAIAFAAGHAAEPISAQALAVAHAVLKSMVLVKIKLAVLVTLVAAVVTLAAGEFGAAQTDPAAAKIAQPTAAPANDTASGDNESGVPLRVLHQGQPIAGAKVWAFLRSGAGETTTVVGETRRTDAAGRARIPATAFTRDDGGVNSFLVRDDAGRVGGQVIESFGKHLSTIAVEMLPSVDLVGRIEGAAGKPLAGIEVSAIAFGSPVDSREFREDDRILINVPSIDAGTQRKLTDADGQFVLTAVPKGLMAQLRIKADGYGVSRVIVSTDEPATLTLEKVGSLRVTLNGADGKDGKGLPWSLRTNYAEENYFHAYNGRLAGVEPTGGKTHPYFYRWGEFGDAPFVINDIPAGIYFLETTGGGAVAVWSKPAAKRTASSSS